MQAEYGSVTNLAGQQAGEQNVIGEQGKGDQTSTSMALALPGMPLNIFVFSYNMCIPSSEYRLILFSHSAPVLHKMEIVNFSTLKSCIICMHIFDESDAKL